jgi:serine/threonine-protein phosphatase 4 regulatory subunit 1
MYFSGDDMHKLCIVENIRAYAISPKYNERQVFIFMVDPLINNFAVFKENFMKEFLMMAGERVPNNRIMLAQVVHKHAILNIDGSNKQHVEEFLGDPDIQKMILKLKSDKERDILALMSEIEIDL